MTVNKINKYSVVYSYIHQLFTLMYSVVYSYVLSCLLLCTQMFTLIYSDVAGSISAAVYCDGDHELSECPANVTLDNTNGAHVIKPPTISCKSSYGSSLNEDVQAIVCQKDGKLGLGTNNTSLVTSLSYDWYSPWNKHICVSFINAYKELIFIHSLCYERNNLELNLIYCFLGRLIIWSSMD